MASKSNTLYTIQYLRALAAIAVVIFHAGTRTGYSFHLGNAGVDLFFIISGFLMVSITNEATKPLAFLWNRAKRIVPLYWLATTLILFAGLMRIMPNLPTKLSFIVSSYLFIPAISPANGEMWPLLIPGWTLNYEMFFYLVFSLCLLIHQRFARVASLSIFLVLLVTAGLVWPPQNPILMTYTNPLMLEFVAGAWLGLLWQDKSLWNEKLGLAAIVLAIGSLAYFGQTMPNNLRVIGFGIPCLMLLYGALSLESAKSIVKKWAFPKFIGDASYSIYLWHVLAVSVGVKAQTILHIPAPLTLCLCVIGGVLAGCASYLLIEKPLMTHLRHKG